jgi:acetylornithine deacetylase/succinyl-diaminopimelate desuccinylase-like protein
MVTDMSAVEIAEDLIRFDTSGPPARERPLARWIGDFLEDAGFRTELQDVAPDRANVVAKIG